MTFLAPFWLGLAALAAVPLVLHLWRRRIGVRVEFPAARYLRRAEEEHSRDLKVKNLLLMLLRVLAILALALAAARPAARLPGGGHAPTALAIVLDNSLSTTVVAQGEPVLERLRRAAARVAGKAASTDKLWLVTADGVVVSGNAATIGAAIARVEPLAGAGDVAGALRRAAALARAATVAPIEEAEVALVTDGQASAFRAPVVMGAVRVTVHAPAVELPGNHAVTDAVARPIRWTPRGTLAARVRGPGDSVTWRATLAGRTLARGTTAADARGSEVTIAAAPPERGWLAATIELEPDELRGDDVGHAAVFVGPAPGLYVSPNAGPFARSAADALVQAGNARASGGGAGDVAFTAAEELVRLPALIAAPLDPVRVGAANRALERAGVPWRFGAPLRGDVGVASDDSLLASRTGGVTAPLRYPLVRAGSATADTLARVGREPWIVSGPGYVIVASPLDPAGTSLPVRASFVPWVAQVLAGRLAGEPGAMVRAAPLARVALPAGADELELPDGATVPARGDSISAPGAPGVYLVRRAARRIGALVVNVEPEESELRRLARGELAGRLEARAVTVNEDEQRFVASAFGAGARRPLTGWCLGVALAALLAETLVAARGSRASRRAPGAGGAGAAGARAA